MNNVQSSLSKFPWRRKRRKLKGTCWGLVKRLPDYGVSYVIDESFLTFPLGFLPSETDRSERRIWGTVPPGYFHHRKKICRKVVTEHVSWLLLEPYWRGVYCQLQTKEAEKGVLYVSKTTHLFSYFCCIIAWSSCKEKPTWCTNYS